jgi:hypothetical protein
MFLNGQYNPETSRNIWVGIQLHPEVKDLDQLCFFFDFKNTDNKKQLFRIFHSCDWYFKGKKIKTHNGLCYQDGEKLKDIFSDYDPMLLIEREVRHLYDEHFVTLTDEDLAIGDNSNFQLYPDEFASVFMRSDLAKFKDNLIWIKIVTPTQIEERVLIDLYLTINAFPVINRKLRDFIYRFKGVSNIIPVETDEYEYFLSVQSLRDGFNKEYKQIPYSEAEQEKTGTYSVRKSGTERIDSRSAREFLMYLVELMRDESAAFSSYGQDAVNNMLKELDRILAMLEQRIKKNNPHADTGHYVSVDYENRDDAFFLNYWVTNSIYGNGIHAGTKLAIYQGSQVKNGTIQFLTNTLGGKMALEPARHIDAYKYAMLSHNKIVTVEDIKAFCFYELGDRIADVGIRKGLVIGENPKQGLVRCVDVILKKKKRLTGEPDETEWGIILNSLKSKMELRSSLNLNIRFLLDE